MRDRCGARGWPRPRRRAATSSSTCRCRRSAVHRSSDEGAIPKDRDVDAADIPSTYVPARNTVFLSLALAWAEVLHAEASSSASTRSTTPDIPTAAPSISRRSSGWRRWPPAPASKGSNCASWRRSSRCPRREIIRRGIELGVDYGLTLSCYDPVGGRPCGHCDSCTLRARGFEQAGLPDPAVARASQHRS